MSSENSWYTAGLVLSLAAYLLAGIFAIRRKSPRSFVVTGIICAAAFGFFVWQLKSLGASVVIAVLVIPPLLAGGIRSGER